MRFSDPNRGSRHERGYGTEWDHTVKRIRARDHDLCQRCIRRDDGHIGLYSAVDHITQKSQGGSDNDSNLEVICKPCHTAKTQAESMGGGGRISGG